MTVKAILTTMTVENNSNSKKKERIPQWIQYMQTNNSSLEKFKRANGGYMLRDISKSHKILSIHAELQINVEDHSKNPYYHNVTKRDISTAPLVPLLPGHCVIGKF
ncbi:8385_t:CDS:2, partial [Entrophospora sp. SA101]